MKKRHLLGILLTLVLMIVSACNSGESASSDDQGSGDSSSTENQTDSGSGETGNKDAEEQEQVEIRFTWWGDTGRNEIYNAIVDRFEEENPNITVKREFGGWTDYWDKLTTQTAGGNAPDVVSMHQFYVSDYARRGALLPLNDFIDSGIIDTSNTPDSVINSGKIDDDVFMIAKGITMSGYVYNTAVLDELGIDYPDLNWTYEDLEKLSKQVVEASGGEIYGTSDYAGGQLQPNFRYYLRSLGKDLFTEDGQLGFESDDLNSWWAMWDSFRQQGLIPDAATTTEYEGAPLEQNMFVTGKTAFSQIPANQITLYQNQFDEGEIQIVRIPTPVGGDSGEFIEGAYLSVTESSENPEEAAKFINFFVNTEKSLELFKVEQGAPGNTKMSEFIKPLLEAPQVRTVEFIENTVELAKPAPYSPTGVTELEQVYKDNASAIAFGQMTVEEAVVDFMDQAERILK
ncbi:ABC transporter substrate-binding protein [Aquibacillus salsiterrae]|uniref:Sugar ABC transporter substrate-binding protein n=1 Tax=Aquibacillus salsiterrae TaxID=2950439 RepID=A0A9X3WGG2_9BACI|nr:sugar ABC transporter substrate-binding protein [Aquibacillus salsiterrae]MDC3418558.1 sugar ABC transporter substrate-binding protein [Aquibacillus salsiterrae]